jgi:hypothetical protein
VYSYIASSIIALGKLYAYGGSEEPAYPSTDADWVLILNALWRDKLYPRMLRKGGDRWAYKTVSVTLTASSATYPLSGTTFVADNDFHRVKRFVIEWDSQTSEDLYPLEERERSSLKPVVWGRNCTKRYVVKGNVLELLPTPATAETATLVYIPQATTIASTVTTISGPEGFAEVLALELAIAVLQSQKEDAGHLERRLASAYESFDEAVSQLHHDESVHVVDVRPEGDGYYTFYDNEPRA